MQINLSAVVTVLGTCIVHIYKCDERSGASNVMGFNMYSFSYIISEAANIF